MYAHQHCAKYCSTAFPQMFASSYKYTHLYIYIYTRIYKYMYKRIYICAPTLCEILQHSFSGDVGEQFRLVVERGVAPAEIFQLKKKWSDQDVKGALCA